MLQPLSQLSSKACGSDPALREPRPLSEADAIDIWIARWLRTRPVDLRRRYGCDPRRLYEIWEGARHPAAGEKAKLLFARRYPDLIDRIDFGPHRRARRTPHPDQMMLFE